MEEVSVIGHWHAAGELLLMAFGLVSILVSTIVTWRLNDTKLKHIVRGVTTIDKKADEINGTVRRHGNRLTAIETRCATYHGQKPFGFGHQHDRGKKS